VKTYPAGVRLAGEDDVATLLHLQVVVGARPPGWREDTWTYDECIFSSSVMTSVQVGALLGTPGEHMFKVGGAEIAVISPVLPPGET
jgi:hypothetical protein